MGQIGSKSISSVFEMALQSLTAALNFLDVIIFLHPKAIPADLLEFEFDMNNDNGNDICNGKSQHVGVNFRDAAEAF